MDTRMVLRALLITLQACLCALAFTHYANATDENQNTCLQVNGAWKCGCRDTACAPSAWQLQKVTRTATAGGGDGILPVCGNSSCEAGETAASCSDDCNSSAGPNLVSNPGFEHGTDGWAITNSSETWLDTKTPHSGPA